MKALLFSLLFLVLTSIGSFAQSSQQRKSFSPYGTAGLRGGLNLASIPRLTGSGMHIGFHAGLFGERHSSKSFGYGGEIGFSNQGSKSGDIDLNLNYLSIPVFINIYAGNVTFQGGGYGAFLLSSTVEARDISGNFPDMDYGALLGLKVGLGKTLALGVKNLFGLKDLNESGSSDTALRNNNLQFSLYVRL